MINRPDEIVILASDMAEKKSALPLPKLLVLSFLAGAYIAIGGLLSIILGGGIPEIAAQNPGLSKFLSGAAFPLGLMLVVFAGAELFTGNNAYFMAPVLNKKLKWTALVRNWTWVYIGNFFGAIFVAFVIVHLTQTVSKSPWLEFTHAVAVAKTSAPFYVVLIKGIGANWLVCLALWLAFSSKDMIGKLVGMWWPVMAFVAMGFEHSIANMFFIPLAIFEGADITWASFLFDNLIPATLGNIIGGGFFVGGLYWYIYSKDSSN